MGEDKSKDDKMIGERLSEAITDSLLRSESEKKIFQEGLLNGYFQNEIDTLNKSTFISTTKIFPLIFKNIGSSLIKYNKTNDKKIKLNVDIISTMLPRHYWNYPSPLKLFCTTGSKEFLITRQQKFTDDYKEWLSEFIENEHNHSEISRITIIADKKTFLKSPKSTHNKNIIDSSYFSKIELIEDLKLFVNPIKPISIDDLELEDYKKVLGILTKEESKKFIACENENKKIVKKLSAYKYFDKSINGSINVFDYFVEKLHSEDSGKRKASFCFVADVLLDQPDYLKPIMVNNKSVTPLLIGKLPDITPDFIYFKFDDPSNNDKNIPFYEVIIVGKVNLAEESVIIDYYDNVNPKTKNFFKAYKKAYNLLKQNSYDYNFDKVKIKSGNNKDVELKEEDDAKLTKELTERTANK